MNKERIPSVCFISVSFQVCFSQYLPVRPKHVGVELKGIKSIYFSCILLDLLLATAFCELSIFK